MLFKNGISSQSQGIGIDFPLIKYRFNGNIMNISNPLSIYFYNKCKSVQPIVIRDGKWDVVAFGHVLGCMCLAVVVVIPIKPSSSIK
jgi:hypothetical protein